MKRREFVACGLAGSLLTTGMVGPKVPPAKPSDNALRDHFPRMSRETYINAASLMPLGAFTQRGVNNYMAYQQLGEASGQHDYIETVLKEIRGRFGAMIGAGENEIGLIHCTKAGEQIALEAVDAIRVGGNIVTNDLHFSGSLHNLLGLKKAGRDVRIVKARDWKVPLEAMEKAIDGNTALVAVSLISNVNGHIEDMAALSQMAHRKGALVYADIVQAAGVLPIDVEAMGIDVAACSTYKWLYGVFGAGFVYVRHSLQGGKIPDRMHPGRVGYNYAPWTSASEKGEPELGFDPNDDATRYQPGHVSYMGYCGAYEGLKFLEGVGVAGAQRHSVALNQRLKSQLDPKRYRCISTHLDASPIITFTTGDGAALKQRLKAANLVVTIIGNRVRISPAMYNTQADIDALAKVMNA